MPYRVSYGACLLRVLGVLPSFTFTFCWEELKLTIMDASGIANRLSPHKLTMEAMMSILTGLGVSFIPFLYFC